jgi:hypothetical protein
VASSKTTKLEATLQGNEEVPGPGDRNGKGEAQVALKPQKRKVCWALEWSRLDGASAAHIHKGPEGEAGPVKVLLFEADPPLDGEAAVDGCAKDVKRKLIRKIAKRPERFYVNVHNADYPDGAIRGQLALAD